MAEMHTGCVYKDFILSLYSFLCLKCNMQGRCQFKHKSKDKALIK